MSTLTPEDIDAILPQTQCGLCGYGGCMPYAEALVFEHAAINLCPPGGLPTLHKLGAMLSQDPAPHVKDMEQKAKPKKLAVIREDECIGCTKCIQACPVDAILGGAKQMHTVLVNECTGCELCVAPCPVDCIDLIPTETNEADEKATANLARKRFNARQKRLAQEKSAKDALRQVESQQKKRNYVQEAIARAKQKKLVK
jgi:Na+-translocating ferredoxin:NAD+ oxidoreductase subunit B